METTADLPIFSLRLRAEREIPELSLREGEAYTFTYIPGATTADEVGLAVKLLDVGAVTVVPGQTMGLDHVLDCLDAAEVVAERQIREQQTEAWVAAGNTERRVAHLEPGWVMREVARRRAERQAKEAAQ